jgi:hypothetical protein
LKKKNIHLLKIKIFGEKEKIWELRKMIIFSELLLSYPTTTNERGPS